MSKGMKNKLKELDTHIQKINHHINENGYNIQHLRDTILQKRIDMVNKIGRKIDR